ncbi:MAG TPA: hypothetical protein VNK52_03250 [Hyphomicrobiaceae bacterium]|nr:hypothetical protein [Hyphomicrobiaceae bacterium]
MPDQAPHVPPPSPGARARRWRLLLPLIAVGGVLTAMVVVYLSYDLLSARLSPCEAIFRQTSVNLSTKIRFLKAEGEVQIGKEPLVELDERAQITALNLKTCCTVLAAGKLDPEQFLQCKSKARAYEARLEDVIEAVRTAMASRPGADVKAVSASSPVTTGSIQANTIQRNIQAARAVSQEFNREVVEVQRRQAVERLKAIPPRHVEISAEELEPNDDVLSVNLIDLGKWITASVGSQKDADYFAFKTPPDHRDWIRIEVENRSTTLEPRIELFGADKASLGTVHRTTPGADVTYAFVGAPDTRYYFRVSNYYGSSVGSYLVRVIATKAYDAHEPNEDILSARTIALGDAVKAEIMDKSDVDYFRIESGAADELLISIKNASTTLRPALQMFDASKANIATRYTTTGGADVSYVLKVQPRSAYYLRIADYYSDAAGAYVLTVTAK